MSKLGESLYKDLCVNGGFWGPKEDFSIEEWMGSAIHDADHDAWESLVKRFRKTWGFDANDEWNWREGLWSFVAAHDAGVYRILLQPIFGDQEEYEALSHYEKLRAAVGWHINEMGHHDGVDLLDGRLSAHDAGRIHYEALKEHRKRLREEIDDYMS